MNIRSKRKKKICAAIMMLAGIGAVWHILWKCGAFLPEWIVWNTGTIYDQSGKYEIVLDHKSVRILSGDEVLWTSPKEIKVQKVLSGDIDNDHEDELILLCWKIGRYGEHKPFWVEQDEQKWSQHIFVYEYANGEIRPKWMSSYMGVDAADIAVSGEKSSFRHLLLTDLKGNMSSWRWDSWGFTKEDTDVTFVVFGDNLIHEPIYRYGLYYEETFDFLFENFKETISQSDVAVLNQETPFTDNPAMYSDYPRFGTPLQVGQAIVNAGFDVVTCATNHALDRGAEGIDTTKNFFDSHKITCLGIQEKEDKDYHPYEVIKKNGIRFALLNYTYGTNGIKIPEENPYMVHLLEDEESVRTDIEKAGADTDFVIVFVHWGTEYSGQPDEFQQKWAQLFLESGVDVVVGTHPHVLQPYELLKDDSGHEMLIYYSIGNYISAQPEKFCIKGGMAGFTVSLTPEGYRITDYTLQPLRIVWQKGGTYKTDFLLFRYYVISLSVSAPAEP